MHRQESNPRSTLAVHTINAIKKNGYYGRFQKACEALEEARIKIDQSDSPGLMYESFDIAFAKLLEQYIPEILKKKSSSCNLENSKFKTIYHSIKRELIVNPATQGQDLTREEDEELDRLYSSIPKCKDKSVKLKANLAETSQIGSIIILIASGLGLVYSIINSLLGTPAIQPITPIECLISCLLFALVNQYTHQAYDPMIRKSKHDLDSMETSCFSEITKMTVLAITSSYPSYEEKKNEPSPTSPITLRTPPRNGALSSPISSAFTPTLHVQTTTVSTRPIPARRLPFTPVAVEHSK